MSHLDNLRAMKKAKAAPKEAEIPPEEMAEFVMPPYKDNGNGTYDCIFIHPEYGNTEFTADPNDPEPHGRAAYAYILTQLGG